MEITETVYVPTRAEWRAWLAKHHATKREIWLIYYKKGSGKPRVAYDDAVEEALCYGWIDSTTKAVDADRYAQRFTPRKAGSDWAMSNLIRIKRLVAAGLMTPAGAVHLPSKRAARSFEQQHHQRKAAPTAAPKDLATAIRKVAGANAFWKTLTPGYRRLYVRWIIESKQAETRARRIVRAVDALARGVKNPGLESSGRPRRQR